MITVVKLYILEHAILLSRTNLESLADQKRSADRTLGITGLIALQQRHLMSTDAFFSSQSRHVNILFCNYFTQLCFKILKLMLSFFFY
jgi:CHASE1-domain containing sensor protein